MPVAAPLTYGCAAAYNSPMKQKARQTFSEIGSTTWEHPADRATLATLQKIPGLDQVVKFFLSFTSDRALRLLYLGSSVRVSDKQFPRVNTLVQEACTVLDYQDELDVFVTYDPRMNAGAIGVNRPFLTLNSSIVAALDDEELIAVIGHELGHCMSGHVLYKTLLWALVSMGFRMVRIPGADLLTFPIVAALKEWDRKSELSADRAGLLVCQNPEVSYRVLMKLAGGEDIGQMDINEFLVQASEYAAGGDVIDSVHKMLNTWTLSHPFPVVRVPELKRWVDDGSYQAIRDGAYARRGEERPKAGEQIKRAHQRYKSDFEQSDDPFASAVKGLGRFADSVGQRGEELIKNLSDKLGGSSQE